MRNPDGNLHDNLQAGRGIGCVKVLRAPESQHTFASICQEWGRTVLRPGAHKAQVP